MKMSTPGSSGSGVSTGTPKPPPSSAAPAPPAGTPLYVREGVIGAGSYRVSVFRWSDGKFGGTVDVSFPFQPGKSPKQVGDEANNYACEMLRDLNEILARTSAK